MILKSNTFQVKKGNFCQKNTYKSTWLLFQTKACLVDEKIWDPELFNIRSVDWWEFPPFWRYAWKPIKPTKRYDHQTLLKNNWSLLSLMCGWLSCWPKTSKISIVIIPWVHPVHSDGCLKGNVLWFLIHLKNVPQVHRDIDLWNKWQNINAKGKCFIFRETCKCHFFCSSFVRETFAMLIGHEEIYLKT